MNRVIVDTTVLSKLGNLSSSLELCDESGVTLGYFVPAAEEHHELYEWARRAFSQADIELSRQQAGGRTTEEVLARLASK